jgi:MFS transporter, SP family, sugar:H+ symporter
MGLGLAWPTIMAFGVQFLDESPRWDCRRGNTERAGRSIARTYSVTPGHSIVTAELQEIQTALNAESAAEDVQWHDVFKARTMLHRIFVGMVLQMMQQMTGINYFFYYGTSLFAAAGVGDSYVTQVILGAVNFLATLAGLWIAGNVGHRRALVYGGTWISFCLFVSHRILLQ